MGKKGIPIIITLVACLITCVVSIIQGVEFSVFFLRFVVVLGIFGTISIIIAVIIRMNFKDVNVDGELVGDEANEGNEFDNATNENVNSNDEDDEDEFEDEEDY